MAARDDRTKGAFTAPWLMLCFALLAIGFGIHECSRAGAQPEPESVACERATIEAAGDGRWIVAHACYVDWDAAEEREIGSVERQVVPVLTGRDGTRTAMLVTRHRSSRDISGTQTIEGVVDRSIDGLPSIDRDDKPRAWLGPVLISGAVLLLVLAAYYTLRALTDATSPARRFAASRPAAAPPFAPPPIVDAPPVHVAPSTWTSTSRPRKRGTLLDRGDDFNFVLLFALPPLGAIGMTIHQFVTASANDFNVPVIAIMIVPFTLLFVWGLLQQRGEDHFEPRLRMANPPTALDDEVVVFDHVASLIMLSVSFPSRPLLVGIDRIWPTQLLATIVTFVFGWWALPFGPFKTIGALARNLSGGRRETVAEFVARRGRKQAPEVDV